MLKVNFDAQIPFKTKRDDLLTLPIIIRVNSFDEASVKTFQEEFSKAELTDQPVIPIIIDSYGGSVDAFLSMEAVIKRCRIPVATIVEGKAMSAGAALFTCGTEGYRFIAPNARLMIHEVSSWVCGKLTDIKADTKETNRLNDQIFSIMATNCGKPADYFLKILKTKSNTDWFLTSREALKHGIANKIGLPLMSVNVSVKVDFSIPKKGIKL